MLFQSLDFLYMPSADVAADVAYFTEVLGGELGFAIEAMGTRVAMVRLAPGPPDVLLAGHLEGERPVLVYRVAGLDAAVAELRGPRLGGRAALRHPARADRRVHRAGRPPAGHLRAHAPRGP